MLKGPIIGFWYLNEIFKYEMYKQINVSKNDLLASCFKTPKTVKLF